MQLCSNSACIEDIEDNKIYDDNTSKVKAKSDDGILLGVRGNI